MRIEKSSKFSVHLAGVSRAMRVKVHEIFALNKIKWTTGEKADEYISQNDYVYYNVRGTNFSLHHGSESKLTVYTAAEFIKKYKFGKTFEFKGKIYRELEADLPWAAAHESEYKNLLVKVKSCSWVERQIMAVIPAQQTKKFVDTCTIFWEYAAEYVKDVPSKKVEMTIAEIEAKLGIENLKIKKG